MIKFRSRVTGDVIMLQATGQQILKILGKNDADSQNKGIVLPVDMPAAISALQAAVAAEEALRKQLIDEARANGEPAPRFEGVSLRQRTTPLIDMFRRCQAADKEVVWGV